MPTHVSITQHQTEDMDTEDIHLVRIFLFCFSNLDVWSFTFLVSNVVISTIIHLLFMHMIRYLIIRS